MKSGAAAPRGRRRNDRRHPPPSGRRRAHRLLPLLITAVHSVIVVPETEQAVIARFGKPVRISRQQARRGINWRHPIRRERPSGSTSGFATSTWTSSRCCRPTSAGSRSMPSPATASSIRCACIIAARTVDRVEQALKPILGSQLRNELGKRPFASLLSPEREGAMENIRAGLDRVARQYGVEIVDVRIKKADLPDGTPLESAYDRMRTARQQEARSIEAEGSEAGADHPRRSRCRGGANLCRRVRQGSGILRFLPGDAVLSDDLPGPTARASRRQTNIILSPNNEYLKEFTGR